MSVTRQWKILLAFASDYLLCGALFNNEFCLGHSPGGYTVPQEMMYKGLTCDRLVCYQGAGVLRTFVYKNRR